MKFKHLIVTLWFLLLVVGSGGLLVAIDQMGTGQVTGIALAFYFLMFLGGAVVALLISDGDL